MKALSVLLLFFIVTNCGEEEVKTRIAVKNNVGAASKIKVRDSSNESKTEVDFGEVEEGIKTACREVSWTAIEGVNINGTDGAENGNVDLQSGKDHLITVHPDGTEPTVEIVTDLCK